MGSGIAQFFSGKALHITLYDPELRALTGAREKIQQSTAGTGNELIKYTTDLGESIQEADLVIETAPEVLSIKLQLYNDITPFLKEGAIVASNTSTFPLGSLSADQHFADRMINMHFFNPAHLIPLVEVVDSEKTLPGLTAMITRFLVDCGKKPVVLKKDIYGFIANRLQAAVLREACYLLENGIADARQIDGAMKDGLAIRWILNGPFEIADFGGLDTWERVLNNLLPLLGSDQQAADTIRQKVEKQQLGLKTGKGFFEYPGTSQGKIENSRNEKLIQVQKMLEQIESPSGNGKDLSS